eukprot:scaffold298187_cov32-Prasinocladus_malaysianus.AAC.1
MQAALSQHPAQRQAAAAGVRALVSWKDYADSQVSEYPMRAQAASRMLSQPARDGQTPVFTAVANRFIEALFLLLNAGADTAAVFGHSQHTALHLAAIMDWLPEVSLLLAADPTYHGCNPRDALGNTPLLEAARHGCEEVAMYMLRQLSNGAAALELENQPDNHMDTPLHAAAKTGDLRCLELLTSFHCGEMRVDIYAKNSAGLTAYE